MTHPQVWTAKHRRSEPGRVRREQLSQGAANAENRGGRTDTQVWNWAEIAVLSGYGPAASSILRRGGRWGGAGGGEVTGPAPYGAGPVTSPRSERQ
jgi:hypothetical protein